MSKANRKTVTENQVEPTVVEAVENLQTEGITELPKVEKTAEELIKEHGNKSNAIRAMSAQGMTRAQIAKALNIRYQHVNNVLHQVLKREIKKERDEKNGNGATETKTEE
jgi:hypothetical protein